MRRWLYLMLPMLLTLVLGAPAHAQPLPGGADAKDSAQGVYVRDSAVAIEKFALAERMERLGEWAKSADIYQEIAAAYADRVTPSLTDNDNRIYQYTSVVAAVQERLAKWPAEGLAVYKDRFEPEAAALLKATGDDREGLTKALSFYFVTDAARDAGLRLIESSLENGEFPAAAWLGDRLLRHHPGLQDARPRLLYLTAIAHSLAGNPDAGRRHLATLEKDFSDAVGSVRGRATRLAESLAAELPSMKPLTAGGSTADSWPMAFGGPDRSRVPAFNGFGGAKLFSVELTAASPRAINSATNREIAAANVRDRARGQMTGVFPAVDRGELFFQDNARLYAVGLESGAPLPGWAQTYDGDRRGRFTIPAAAPTPRHQQNTVTLTDESVLAVMGQPDVAAMQNIGVPVVADARLVCLDRRTGREKWTLQPKSLPEEFANLRQVAIQGSPLVVDSNVYVQARGSKGGMQFEDAYVLCIDLGTGKLRWTSYLASAGSGAQMDMDFGGSSNGPTSHLAFASGRVYAMTNLGALACIDAYGGSIHWLNIYPREQAINLPGVPAWARQRNPDAGPRPWSYNPVFVKAGKVFTLPGDGSNMLIYDAASGVEISRISLQSFRMKDKDGSEQSAPDTIIGVVNDKLLVSSGTWVFCIDWTKYDAKKPWHDNCTWYYAFRKPGPDYQKDTIAGRAFVTAEALYVPTLWGLIRFEAKSDYYNLTHVYPAQGKWGDDEGPGNVLVTQDNLIVAGPERVTVYTDLGVATRKLDEAIAAVPTDAEPRLRYAEILFIAGKTDDAVAKLDESIGLLGGRGSMSAGAARDRVYANAIAFAERLSKDAREQSSSADDARRRETIAGLYDRARAAAQSPAQQVNYRLSRAGYARAFAGAFAKPVDAAAEDVRLHQEILSEPKYRSIPTAQGPAGAVARRAIDAAIAAAGQSVYAPYETAAAAALESASPADSDKLLAVAHAYPNSSVAGRAALAAAGAYETAGHPRAAVQVLRQRYADFRDPADRSPERAKVIESLVRNYLRLPGGVEVASARLDRSLGSFAKSTLTAPLTMPDGKPVDARTFEEAAAFLRKASPSYVRPLVDLRLPRPDALKNAQGPRLAFKPEDPESVVEGVTSLVLPLPEFARTDRVVAVTSNGVAIFSGGHRQPRSLVSGIARKPVGCAWVGPGLLLWTDSAVSLIRDDASVAWTFEPKSVEMIDVAAAPAGESNDAVAGGGAAAEIPGVVLRRNAVLQMRAARLAGMGPGAAIADAAVPLAQSAGESVGQVRPLADGVVLSTSQGRVFALDITTGAPRWQSRPGDTRPDRLLVTDDFVAARVADESSATLTVIDAFSGAFVYRKLFSADGGLTGLPINFTLTPDGTLLYSLSDRLCAKDLFEAGDKLRFGDGPPRTEAPRWFEGSVNPEHLLVADGRVVAVTDNGAYVRVFSLETGRLLRSPAGDNDFFLQTRITGGPAGVSLKLLGSRLYVIGHRVLTPYDLDRPAAKGWRADLSINVRDVVVTPDYFVVLGAPGSVENPRRDAPQATILQAAIYSRAVLPDGRESGLLAFEPRRTSISNPAGITNWQAVDGGLYYRTADDRLHFLAGARE